MATSETSARVGTGSTIIDSSIWVATTTGLPARRAARVICFWRAGTVSSGSSTPRSPRATMMPSAISRISSSAVERRRLLDLGHHAGASGDELARLGDVIGALHEGQRDPVDAEIGGEIEIGAVLFGQRREWARMVSGRLRPFLSDNVPPKITRVIRRSGFDFGDFDAQAPVIEQQIVARLDRGEDLGMRR